MKKPFEIWILAGGLSSRIGRDKARITLQRKSLLARIKEEAAKTGWAVHTVRKDAVERCGPLGGIYTALKKAQAEIVLFLACDMPWISAALLKQLAGSIKPKTAAVFTKHEKFAGFPFALRKSTLHEVEQQIQSGDLSLQTLARNTHAKVIRAKASELLDIDTPDDLTAARVRLKP